MTVVSVSSRSGSLRVICENRADVSVEGGERRGRVTPGLGGDSDRIAVTPASPSTSLEIRCPIGTDVFCSSDSGRVEVVGRAGFVGATSESGRIEVGHARAVDARSTSGRIRVARCDEMARLHVVSGRAEVAIAGRADLATTSGAVVAGQVALAAARTASGSVEIDLTSGGSARVTTLSGAVAIGVEAGTHPDLSLRHRSGRVDCNVERGDDGAIDVETTSGSITVRYR